MKPRGFLSELIFATFIALAAFAFCLMLATVAYGQAVEKPKGEAQYGRGYVAPSAEVLKARHAAAFARHDHRMKSLPQATPATYDCRQFGYVPGIKDQGQCGSCWDFSGTGVCEMAFMRAGLMPVNSGGLAEQYGMDCHNWGGCNGGDEAEVIDWCKTGGIPATADYGPYLARSGACKLKSGTKMWKIKDWGYCHADQGQGIASVQEIKNAMVQYGPISVAVDATRFNSYTSGVLSGTGHNIDHAVILIGWDDSKGTKGAWLLRNQWSTQWGEQGYMWIAYGAYDVGTEAIWVTVATLPPPPIPPIPPIPPVAGKGKMVLQIPGMPDQSFDVILPKSGIPAGMELVPEGTTKALQDTQKAIDDLRKAIDSIPKVKASADPRVDTIIGLLAELPKGFMNADTRVKFHRDIGAMRVLP